MAAWYADHMFNVEHIRIQLHPCAISGPQDIFIALITMQTFEIYGTMHRKAKSIGDMLGNILNRHNLVKF